MGPTRTGYDDHIADSARILPFGEGAAVERRSACSGREGGGDWLFDRGCGGPVGGGKCLSEALPY
jgi:hypothetical protein